MMLGTQLVKDLSMEQIKDLMLILEKYPEQFRNFKEQTNQTLENLKKMELFLKEFGIKEKYSNLDSKNGESSET
jgi:hypothetical protein